MNKNSIVNGVSVKRIIFIVTEKVWRNCIINIKT